MHQVNDEQILEMSLNFLAMYDFVSPALKASEGPLTTVYLIVPTHLCIYPNRG